jgi:hypothetical protein
MQDDLAKLCGEFLRRQRFRKQVTLDFIAAMDTQELELLARLDSFGDDLQSQAVRHVDDRDRNSRVVGIGRDIADEGDIDLERIHEEAFEISEI